MYSQGDEETYILKHAPDRGRFLDVGAYDGLTFSNTRALAENGWTGVWVEPTGHAFDAMTRNRIKGVQMVNCALGEYTNLVPFHYCWDAVSTTNKEFAAKWAKHVEYWDTWVMQLSVEEFVSRFGLPFEFISIDTEGTSHEVLKALLPYLDALETSLVCVEHDLNESRIQKLLPDWETVVVTTNNIILKR